MEDEREAVLEKIRNRTPLFTHSIEFEGMSLSFVNPELIEDKDYGADEIRDK